LQCGGIWFANGKFGVTWKLLQAVGQKPRASISGQCFIKLKKTDKDKLKNTAPVEAEEEVVVSTFVEDSDNEEEEEELVEAKSEPVVTQQTIVEEVQVAVDKAVKKKVVKKKEPQATI
jgi:hypothetical protein